MRHFSMAVLAAMIGGVAVVATQQPAQAQLDLQRFEVEGPNPLSASRTATILAPYQRAANALDDLRAAAEALEQAIHDAGYTFHQVIIPPQAISDGVVWLRVVEFPVKQITVFGNRAHSDENVLRSLPGLQIGESPNTRKIARSLAISNLHPTKRTQLVFSAEQNGEEGLNAAVSVSDRRPHQVYTWLNNTGTDETGNTRVGVGYQYGNLFDRDQVITLSSTTSVEESNDVQQFAVNYQIPFYALGGLLNLYALRSDVDTGVVADFFNVSGRGDVLGGQFTYALPKRGAYRQRLTVNIDDKLFDNDIDFQGQPVGVDVRSRPLAARYFGNWRGTRVTGSVYAGYRVNLPGGSNNDDEDYETTRSGASRDWSALRLGGSVRYNLKGWDLVGRLNAQYADEPLIAGEQLGLGGIDSIRGVDERAITGDRGAQANIELWAPQLNTKRQQLRDVRLLGFVDGGRVQLEETLPGEVDSETLVAAGVGLRWSWKDRFNSRLDYGHVVDGADPDSPSGVDDGDNKLHFNLFYRF